ncbi:MAG TPA: hypothetical protein VHC43_00630 [Mycobacteriales bacterium]|nr:hypothetical protein [Mycobacteriales bacterium]
MSVDLTGGKPLEWEEVFASQPDNPEMRESINAWIWDDSGELAIPRLGVEAPGDHWDTHDIQVNLAFADGNVYSMYGAHPIHDPIGADGRPRILGAGPLRMEIVAPYEHLRITVDGVAQAMTVQDQIKGFFPGQTGGEEVRVIAEIDVRPVVPPWENGSMSAEAHRVLTEQDEGGLVGIPWRFEQVCRATGTVTVGERTYSLAGGADRIRRQGVRRLATFRGHAWQAALFPSGRGFGYQTFPERTDGLPTYNEGYVFTGDGELIPATVVQAPWLTELHASGEDVTVVLEAAGQTHEIRGETTCSTFMVMPPEVSGGGMQLQQAVTRYTWDGESGMGMTERSCTTEALGAAD